MTKEARSRSKRSLVRWLVFVGVLATGLAVASAAFAAWTTIEFATGTIDTAAWGTANYTDTNNNGSITDRNEIAKAWVRYDGTNIYFRIDTIGTPALAGTNFRAVGGIDCNHNGLFNDRIVNGPDGDRLIIYAPDGTVNVYGYNSSGVLTFVGAVSGDYSDAAGVSIEWGVPLYLLYPGCRGSTSTIGIGWSTASATGSVVDQASTAADLLNPMDYGDTGQTLPAPPATCGSPNTGLQCDGARHGIVPQVAGGQPLRFGNEAVDADPGNLQNAASDADDTNGSTPNDEQGIYPDATNTWSDGSGSLNFLIVGATSARIGCWIDFNKNGVWTDSGETVLSNVQINSTTTTRGITIPAGLTWPNSFPARCRIWQNVALSPVPGPSGPIEFGEVEDHIWEFDAGGNYIAPGAPSAATGLAIAPLNTADVRLTWTNPAPNNAAHVLAHPTNPYFTSATGGFVVDTTDAAAPWQYDDLGVRGLPADARYYIVYGRLGTTDAAAPSNRVGLFEFGLTAGTP